MHRTRFPGLGDGWARLDGAAGTQMVDDAIEEMAAWMRSGHSANHGGAFQAAERTDALVTDARASVARLLGASAEGVVFGPSMTALTMRFSAAACRSLKPGDEIVCTRLDHDANVAPWLIAAARAGVEVRFAEPEHGTLELPAAAVEAVLSPRTRWVAVTAASNAVGTIPDLPGIVAAAHGAGARVFVDAVHATPHRPSTSRRWAATRWRARPTSGSGRTSGSCGRAPSSSPSCRPTSCGPRRTPCPTAGSSGRCPSSR